jgi:hypothetical protein
MFCVKQQFIFQKDAGQMGHSDTEAVMTDEELDAIFQPQSQSDAGEPSHQPEQESTLVDERWLHMLVARRQICGGDYDWAVRHQDISVERFLKLTDGWNIDSATKKLVRKV